MRPRRCGSTPSPLALGIAAAGRSLRCGVAAASRRALLLSLGLAALGCGHPATRDECEAIFQRSAEIELQAQNIKDPTLIQERTAAVRKARGAELIDRCVGRRVTDGALACVRKATTSEQVDRCLE